MRWEYLAFVFAFVVGYVLGRWRRWRPEADHQPLPLPDPRPGVAGGPLLALVCIGALFAGGCTAAERALIRQGIINTGIGAVNCAAPGLADGIQSAVIELITNAVSGHGAGTADEWRQLGIGLGTRYTPATVLCASDVAARELGKILGGGGTARAAPKMATLGPVGPVGATDQQRALAAARWIRANPEQWAWGRGPGAD